MFLYIFKIIIKLIITLSRFDPGSTSVRPQNPWTSPFYGSMNGPGLKTLIMNTRPELGPYIYIILKNFKNHNYKY